MQISLRSQMIAGVAAVGATAMAITPIAQPDLLPSISQVSTPVSLTAYFQNPITDLVYAAYYAIGDSILSQAELLDPADLFWPDSFYSGLGTEDVSLFAPGYSGLIPDFVNQFSFGGLSAFTSNLAGYGNAIAAGLASLIDGPTSAIWNTPFALITAAGYLAAGQPELALAELQAQIVQPLVDTVTTLLGVTGYILDNAILNATTLITNTIPGLVANTIDTLTNGPVYIVQAAINTLSTAFTDLLAGQLEDAWNGAVNGLLGPNGTLGLIQQLTIGIGITEFVDYGPPDGEVLTVIIPSLRSNLTSAGQRLGTYNYNGLGGIYNDWYDPFPEAPAATAAVEATPAAAPAATVSVPEVADVEVDRPVAGGADAPEGAAVDAADAPASGSDSTAADSDVQAADESVQSSDAGTEGSARGGSSENTGQAKAKATRGSARGAGSAS